MSDEKVIPKVRESTLLSRIEAKDLKRAKLVQRESNLGEHFKENEDSTEKLATD